MTATITRPVSTEVGPPSFGPQVREATGHRHSLRFVGLAVIAFVHGASLSPVGRTASWRYFVTATTSLFSRHGLHTFARHPELQFGPFAMVAAEVVRVVGGADQRSLVAHVLTALLIPILVLAEQTAIGYGADPHRARITIFIGGLLVIPGWNEIAVRTAHIDDALALAFMVAAGWAVSRRWPVVAGVALAFAIDAKPWAVAFVPLVLVFHGRERRNALLACAGLVLVAWAPFIIADHHTLNAARYTIPNDRASALRWIGVHSRRTPFWDRPAQFAIGGAIAAFAVLRRQWPAVLLAALAVRLLLDPATHHYYSAGLLLGALLFDVAVARWTIPWITLIVFALTVLPWLGPTFLNVDHRGEARAFGTLIPLALVLLAATAGGSNRLLRRTGAHPSITSNTG